MNIETNIGCFSSFKTLYSVMLEDGINKVFIIKADWWGAEFIKNEWVDKETVYKIINL